jgi:hypothetical protein
MTRFATLGLGILLSLVSVYYIGFSPASGNKLEVYPEGESPLGISQADWVAKWWNWSFPIGFDPETTKLTGLEENGCLMNKENSMVLLVDTSVGGVLNQKCTISHNEGILIPIWTGECNTAEKSCQDIKSLEELKEKARGEDVGKIKGDVKVDNIPIAKLDVKDYTTNTKENVSEVFTKVFNATISKAGHISGIEKSGIFPAAAHGWFVFLKPLQPGNHTVYYQNTVEPTTLGAGFNNDAKITYHLKVE